MGFSVVKSAVWLIRNAVCLHKNKVWNKILAHSDLYNVIEKENFPVDGVSRAEIEQILEKIRNVTNKIETYFKVPTTYFQKVISSNDAKSLVVALKQVQEYRSIKRRENS